MAQPRKNIDPDHQPGYWMDETSGVLAPVVRTYLEAFDPSSGRGSEPLSSRQLAIMRAYLRQWMDYPWSGDSVPALRAQLNHITDCASLAAWLAAALDQGIDPL